MRLGNAETIEGDHNSEVEARNLAAAVKSLQVTPIKPDDDDEEIVEEKKKTDEAEEEQTTTEPSIPKIPLPFVLDRVLLFDLEHIQQLRDKHNMAGTLIGTLPQIPQQNIFLGLPVELMPEESLYLLSRGIGYIVDDSTVHRCVQSEITKNDRAQILEKREAKKAEMVEAYLDGIKRKRQSALSKKGFSQEEIDAKEREAETKENIIQNKEEEGDDKTIMNSNLTKKKPITVSTGSYSLESAITYSTPAISKDNIPYYATSSSYHHNIKNAQELKSRAIKAILAQTTPAAFATYAYLNDRGYFVSPGLRFGCQFLAYPGDSLRFHSHFMVIGLEYEEKFDILSIVIGGGRLGGAVKKGMMIGGLKSKRRLNEGSLATHTELKESVELNNDWVDCEGDVVTYCVEWAGFG
ncbi:tRNA-intron endonuclease catalytic domain-like protein [Nadsonia fulvescens var. elongata DSM 6958]|uniref:tRNA-intron lyase n=1 Tax=Nadsonia fulvescens var. elongata DSM 6958 TaxID=857566 RepID=A0A1E3PI79_9ASCO|nr:tRNA-intron endonuclease catalytic domain-like protein [Nadsonia fulvescens var. elongata DSM 6958]